MGTNYYHRSSAGWTFSFHGTDKIRSYQGWLKVLEFGGDIVDEYGNELTLEDFKEMIEAKSSAKLNHARDVYDPRSDYNKTMEEQHGTNEALRWNRRIGPATEWLDEDGHSFSGHEFS
jgi:hypothetical protein